MTPPDSYILIQLERTAGLFTEAQLPLLKALLVHAYAEGAKATLEAAPGHRGDQAEGLRRAVNKGKGRQ